VRPGAHAQVGHLRRHLRCSRGRKCLRHGRKSCSAPVASAACDDGLASSFTRPGSAGSAAASQGCASIIYFVVFSADWATQFPCVCRNLQRVQQCKMCKNFIQRNSYGSSQELVIPPSDGWRNRWMGGGETRMRWRRIRSHQSGDHSRLVHQSTALPVAQVRTA
jgi:hypothetical protein